MTRVLPEPELLWNYFSAISAIPRCSCREEAVRSYVIEEADRFGLEYGTDPAGNVVIRKPASPGFETRPTVVLQGHLDMVCEKDQDTDHDFSRDPVTLVREGDWISADGTTLGADNGIAVAMMLALLAGDETAGPLECLFTVDEESGLTGAMKLAPELLTGRILINLDSEDEGIFYIGCAGGETAHVAIPLVRERYRSQSAVPVRVSVAGLQGGHSGIDIHEGRGNSIVLGARLLQKVRTMHPAVKLVDFRGGGKHNAIPREVILDLVCPGPEEVVSLQDTGAAMEAVFREELASVEPDLCIRVESLRHNTSGGPEGFLVLSPSSAEVLNDLMLSLFHGVLGMSSTVPGLVETSANIAAVDLTADAAKILTSYRSSRDSLVDWASSRVVATTRRAGGTCTLSDRYPAWPPRRESPIMDIAVQVYREIYGKDPIVTVVHAGLECGVIRDRVGEMDMISLGPDIRGAHTPRERVSVSSTERTWKLLLAILRAV